jgi:hypothetical protein
MNLPAPKANSSYWSQEDLIASDSASGWLVQVTRETKACNLQAQKACLDKWKHVPRVSPSYPALPHNHDAPSLSQF